MKAIKYRVLHVVDQLTVSSGVSSIIISLISGIPEIRHDVAVYGNHDEILVNTVRAFGGNVYILPNIKSFFGYWYSKAYSSLLQEQTFDIIHGHLVNSAFLYMRTSKRLGINCRVIHSHSVSSSDSLIKKFRNFLLSLGVPFWVDYCISVSNKAIPYFFNPNYTNVIPNGIDSLRFRFNESVRLETLSELSIKDALCVGHIARFSSLKNHFFLLDVFYEMRKQIECVLVLVGDGPLEGSIKKKVNDMGLSDFVIFLGVRHDVERLYQAFDVFLLPSLSEGFGLVVVEAQCSGLVCVASEHVPSSVDCGNIYYLPLGNAHLWADTAIEVSRYPRSDGFDNVNAMKLDLTNMCTKVFDIYQSMINTLSE